MDRLTIVGARQHNLKNLDCELPRNRLVVITGPSGSGKSSLAFDTLYAEGQRRYVESLSASARQLLEQLPRPDVDRIEGLSPAIALRQSPLSKNPRATVGTITEIADYLRILYAKLAIAHCPITGRVLQAQSAEQIVDHILNAPPRTRLILLAPVLHQHREPLEQELERLRKQGFVRVRIDGTDTDISTPPSLEADIDHELQVVIDRLVLRDGLRARVTDSVELALQVGDGVVLLDYLDGNPPQVMSEKLISWEHGITLPSAEPRLFSFNSPQGACPACEGLGVSMALSPERLVDPSRTLREGALLVFGPPTSLQHALVLDEIVRDTGVDPDVAWQELPPATQNHILFGSTAADPPAPTKTQRQSGSTARRSGAKPRARARRKDFRGVLPRLQRLLDGGDDPSEVAEDWEVDNLIPFTEPGTCASCHGSRLRPEALLFTLEGHHIAALSALSLDELRKFFDDFATETSKTPRAPLARPLLQAITQRLHFLQALGLGYLSLDRRANSLSTGEGQRIRLASQLAATMSGVLYVLDEPSAGLHPHDSGRLLETLRGLVAQGNSVVAVEHDRELIRGADYVVDMGPAAGRHGGTIVAAGSVEEIARAPTSVTGPYLRPQPRTVASPRPHHNGSAVLRIEDACLHNLKSVSVELPLGAMTAVTGVSGSGKTSLIMGVLLELVTAHLRRRAIPEALRPAHLVGADYLDKVISIDQSPIGRSPRSNPATYTGIFTLLRNLYATLPEARSRGYGPARFSFNVKGGRCEACRGEGVRRVPMHLLPDVHIQCELCVGKRYNRETLQVRYRGLSIADVLECTVERAAQLFETQPALMAKLDALRSVGLGYLTLGQPATTLSGGEAQRLKLASELSQTATGRTLYILDEPTRGLHFLDTEQLLSALFALRDAGNTIVVIEHDMDLVAVADWVVDLGPGPGEAGGTLVAAGPPHSVALSSRGRSAPHLARSLGIEKTPPSR